MVGDFGMMLEDEMRGEAEDFERLGEEISGNSVETGSFRRGEEFDGSAGRRDGVRWIVCGNERRWFREEGGESRERKFGEEAVRDFGRVENAAGCWAAGKGLAWRGLESARDGGEYGENGLGTRVRGGELRRHNNPAAAAAAAACGGGDGGLRMMTRADNSWSRQGEAAVSATSMVAARGCGGSGGSRGGGWSPSSIFLEHPLEREFTPFFLQMMARVCGEVPSPLIEPIVG